MSYGTATEPAAHATDVDWQRWGEENPYFGVITDERYRRGNLDEAALAQFFRSGQSHVKHVLGMCRKHVAAGFAPERVLDFGCGVGRLVIPFAQEARQVVGIDVSDGMLAEARRNCERHGVGNVVLARSDDALSQVEGSFDLVHSIIVLQHIDPGRGTAIFARLIERLRPGGIAALHLTYAKAFFPENLGQAPAVPPPRSPLLEEAMPPPVPAAGGRRWWRPFAIPAAAPEPPARPATPVQAPPATGADPAMHMNSYPLNPIAYLIQTQAGARHCHLEFSDHGGELGATFYFQRPGALP